MGGCLALGNSGTLGYPSPYPGWLLQGQEELRTDVFAGEADVGGRAAWPCF